MAASFLRGPHESKALGIEPRLPSPRFKRTRRILIDAGLKALAQAKEVLRTLTLAEAARPDDANLERTSGEFRVFFRYHRLR